MREIYLFIFVFVAILYLFVLFRAYWLYKIRTVHIDKVFKFVQKKVEAGSYNIIGEKYHNCIWEYSKMWSCFWIWDLRKMVSDRERFDELYRTPESDDLEAIRKKVIPSTHVANLAGNGGKR